jgi:hypothetical protein
MYNFLVTKNAKKRFNYMNVINPENTTHTIILIPRFYPEEEIIFELTNEANNESETIENSYTVEDGIMNLTFDFSFLNKQRYSFKLTNDLGVIFRGKILATTQETQNFKQTFEIYEY